MSENSILSEQQIADVVAAAQEGRLDEHMRKSKERRGQKVRDIDFLRPAKLTVGQQQRIDTIHQQLASRVGLQFSFEMRTNIEVEWIASSQTTWSDALGDLPPDAFGVILEVLPGRGQAIVVGELPFVLRLIDLMLGGSGEPGMARDMTQIDFRFAERLFGIVVEQLTGSWGEVVDLSFEIDSTQAKIAGALPPTAFDAALTVTLEILHAGDSSTLTFIYPYVSIEKAAHRLLRSYSGSGAGRDKTLDEAVETLSDVSIELLVETAIASMPMEDVLKMAPGDEIRLGPVPTEMLASIERVPSYRVQPFYRGQQHVVQIKGRSSE